MKQAFSFFMSEEELKDVGEDRPIVFTNAKIQFLEIVQVQIPDQHESVLLRFGSLLIRTFAASLSTPCTQAGTVR